MASTEQSIFEKNEENFANNIARKTFQHLMLRSLELSLVLMAGQEGEPNYKEDFKKMVQEIFTEHLIALKNHLDE